MVVPMRKYTFLVHAADYEAFLEALRALGILHVRTPQHLPALQETSQYAQALKVVEAAIQLLAKRQRAAGEDAKSQDNVPGLTDTAEVWTAQEALEMSKQKLQLLRKEQQALAPWGNFSLERIHQIAENNWACSFFTCPTRKFQAQWADEHYLFVVNEAPPDVYFVVWHKPGERPELDAEPLPAPQKDPAALQASIAEMEAHITELEAQLDGYAAQAEALQSVRDELLEHTDKEQVTYAAITVADETVRVLEGFVPRPVEEKLAGAFEPYLTIYWGENPIPEEEPPILLKNGRFARLFEPISKLFALPAYQELDLTPFFAPFFMLFFGFCLGDAGYGLVILLGTLAWRRKASPELKAILGLAHWLGAATILFGLLTGTVFGINLLQSNYEWAQQLRRYMIDSQQAFNLALILGLVQTLFGLALQAINRARQYSIGYALPPVGWIILLLSLLDIAMLKWLLPYSTWSAWLGVGLIVLFSSPKGSIFSRLGKGLWDLYGITGFFGDLLSYVRLFALGISSAILGFVINDIALQIKGVAPVIGPVLFVVFLVVGHGANLLISSLGSFVHPMRLTFVEFYKNAGFQGGGKAYQPFAARRKKDKVLTDNNIQNT